MKMENWNGVSLTEVERDQMLGQVANWITRDLSSQVEVTMTGDTMALALRVGGAVEVYDLLIRRTNKP